MKKFSPSKYVIQSNVPLYLIRILLVSTILGFIIIIHQTLCVGDIKLVISRNSPPLHQLQPEPESEKKVQPDSERNLVKVSLSRTSHALENSCLYPILVPNEETIKDYTHHNRDINCTKMQEDYVTFDVQTSTIYINQTLAQLTLGVDVICSYRPFEGTLRPDVQKIVPTKDWTAITEKSLVIADDQFEVNCIAKNDSKEKETVFKWAFAQIGARSNIAKNTDTRLSLDMILFDSTSLNQFRRHMPKTNEYMTNQMGVFFMEGYNKVADNSMVNLLPVFAGKRFLDHSYKDHKLPSDLPTNSTLDMDAMPFIWKEFATKNCTTYINDDLHHQSRGIFHYPWNEARGFISKPTDYFFRPWQVWHRTNAFENASRFCFGNVPHTKLQLQLVKELMKTYNDRCHFSFSFFCEISHDNPSNLERMDDDLSDFLKTYHQNNDLNHTILFIMGDHGNRISGIQWRYVGRIEERMPLLGIYFPEWFRKLHPEVMENLKLNRNRLISNFDVYKTLKDIVDENFDPKIPRKNSKEVKGQSLFTEISPNRNCMDANIPDNHCTCLEVVEQINSTNPLYEKSVDVVLNYTQNLLEKFDKCQKVTSIVVDKIATYTTNSMVQHGVRNPTEEGLKNLLKDYDKDSIEYVELNYRMVPIDIWAKIRLQHSKKLNKLFVNSGPLVLNRQFINLCPNVKDAPDFCLC